MPSLDLCASLDLSLYLITDDVNKPRIVKASFSTTLVHMLVRLPGRPSGQVVLRLNSIETHIDRLSTGWLRVPCATVESIGEKPVAAFELDSAFARLCHQANLERTGGWARWDSEVVIQTFKAAHS